MSLVVETGKWLVKRDLTTKILLGVMVVALGASPSAQGHSLMRVTIIPVNMTLDTIFVWNHPRHVCACGTGSPKEMHGQFLETRHLGTDGPRDPRTGMAHDAIRMMTHRTGSPESLSIELHFMTGNTKPRMRLQKTTAPRERSPENQAYSRHVQAPRN